MKVLVTGSSNGIGKEVANLFLQRGYDVVGFDIKPATLSHERYEHHCIDVSRPESYPELKNIDIIINNAGVQDEDSVISVNLEGAMSICEKYGDRDGIKSILNVCSTSAHTGAEFPKYSASKGGLLAYTKHLAQRVSKYGATCNSISPGGVITDINKHILESEDLYNQCKEETLLKKWASAKEIAEWIFFITAVNTSMTAQDIIVDNGEMFNYNFIW